VGGQVGTGVAEGVQVAVGGFAVGLEVGVKEGGEVGIDVGKGAGVIVGIDVGKGAGVTVGNSV